jgi:hypothetical protein
LDENIESEFPIGDGSADREATVICPYCAQEMSIALDPGSGTSQEYVEDCQVCCQPWHVRVEYALDGTATVSVAPE